MRESRMSLSSVPFYVCALLSLLAVASELPFFLLASLILLGVAFSLDLRKRYPLSSKYLALFGLLVVVFVIFLSPKPESFSLLLVLLLFIKFFSPKKKIDYYEILLLSFLLFFTGALTGGTPFSFLLLPFFYFLTLCLFLLSMPGFPAVSVGASIALRRHLRLFALYFTIFIVLFLVLPRPALRLFPFSLAGTEVSAYGDVLQIGESGARYSSKKPIFRAMIEGDFSEDSLYWRGVVFSSYRKGNWIALPCQREAGQKLHWGREAGRIRGRVFAENYFSPYVYLLDVPVAVYLSEGSLKAGPGRTVLLGENPKERFSYRFESARGPLKDGDPELYLQLEPELRESLRPLALAVAGNSPDPESAARKIKGYLLENYRYDQEARGAGGDEVLDFLFRSRRGYCEHFATAFVLLLRSIGIPARAVGGFRGGDFNPYGKFYTVRERDAHLWAEVYVPDRGWLRFDPTPTRRVASGKGPIFALASLVELLSFEWSRYFLSYSMEEQLHLFVKALLKWKYIFLFSLFLVFALRFAFKYRKKRRRSGSRRLGHVSRMYLEILEGLSRKGFVRKPGETPLQFARRLQDVTFSRFTGIYYRIRFSSTVDSPSMEEFRLLYLKLKKRR